MPDSSRRLSAAIPPDHPATNHPHPGGVPARVLSTHPADFQSSSSRLRFGNPRHSRLETCATRAVAENLVTSQASITERDDPRHSKLCCVRPVCARLSAPVLQYSNLAQTPARCWR
jgi:hypothetical protein